MVTYLLFLYLIFVNFWNIKPFGYISADTQMIMIALFLFFGCIKYKKRPQINVNGKYKYFKWILAGIFLSMIPAQLFYGQPITQSIITYRAQYTIFAIPALFVISPKLEEIIKSLFWFSVLLLGANLLIKYNHSLFVMKESTLDRIGLSVNTNELSSVAGIEYITIPLFYYLQQIKEKFTSNSFVKVLFLLFVIFIVRNRSTLFPAILFSLYTFIFIKSRYKPAIWIIIAIIGAVFVYNNTDVFNSLIEETTTDLSDQEYNRNKAWNYFLYLFSPNLLCYILGNGYLSAHYSPTMQLLMREGIYNSDVGFIGYWNQFGIIPVVAIFTMYFSVLKKRNKYPFFMKLVVVYSIICGMTTIYYGSSVKIMHLVLFYYLFYYYNKKQIVNKSI